MLVHVVGFLSQNKLNFKKIVLMSFIKINAMLESDFNIYREHNNISFQNCFHSLDDASYST